RESAETGRIRGVCYNCNNGGVDELDAEGSGEALSEILYWKPSVDPFDHLRVDVAHDGSDEIRCRALCVEPSRASAAEIVRRAWGDSSACACSLEIAADVDPTGEQR